MSKVLIVDDERMIRLGLKHDSVEQHWNRRSLYGSFRQRGA